MNRSSCLVKITIDSGENMSLQVVTDPSPPWVSVKSICVRVPRRELTCSGFSANVSPMPLGLPGLAK